MNVSRASLLLTLLGLALGCSHPIEIVGEGDVLSASGTRDCYLEEYLAGTENCSKNLVVLEYHETYYAVPREGWAFTRWNNCFFGNESSVDQCSFSLDAGVVRQFWGETAAPLVAVFEKITSPPEPVAMYSYAVDDAGWLIDPLPLEGAQLQRRAAYFTFTGDYDHANFWCCKVADGEEAHGEKVEDIAAPFVLRVDLGALPDDAGLTRELYADLFTSATDFSGHTAYWTLESSNSSPVVFDDGGTHTIDYTVQGEVWVANSSTVVNVLDGAVLMSGIWVAGGTLNIYGGDVQGSFSADMQSVTHIYGGNIAGWIRQERSEVYIYGGSVGEIRGQNYLALLNIQGGSVASITSIGYTSISGGTIGAVFAEGETGELTITGGIFTGEILFDNVGCKIIGGEFQAGITSNSVRSCDIKGGQFSEPFFYTEILGSIYTPIRFTFHGDLQVSETVQVEGNEYQSEITGTLADGSALSQTITCYAEGWYPDFVGTFCQSVEIVNDQ